jgi:hypothetical protein
MDNITKGFVIAACSVVIAVGGVWLDGRHKYSKALRTCIALQNWLPSLPAEKYNLMIYCAEKVQFVRN